MLSRSCLPIFISAAIYVIIVTTSKLDETDRETILHTTANAKCRQDVFQQLENVRKSALKAV